MDPEVRLSITTPTLLAACALTTIAEASALPDLQGPYLPVGLSFGGTSQGSDALAVGGELSAVYFTGLPADSDHPWFWVGGVADAVWAIEREALRHRVGAEAGWAFVGLELAYLGELDDGAYHPGINVRATLGFAALHVYGGYGHLFGAERTPDFAELGGLVKFPIPLHRL